MSTTFSFQLLTELKEHKGFLELQKFNANLINQKLTTDQSKVFAQNLVAFNHGIYAGILSLAYRLTDRLLEIAPDHAHKIGKLLVETGADEFGVGKGEPHYLLQASFAKALGCTRNEVHEFPHAFTEAIGFGENVYSWYREKSVAFGLGLHFASEGTSLEEFSTWEKVFHLKAYPGIKPKSAAEIFLKIHATFEPQHQKDTLDAVTSYLSYFPDEQQEVKEGMRAFLDGSRSMFSRMNKEFF